MNIYTTSKICSTCKCQKPFSEFSKNKSKKEGINSICKSCSKIYDKNRRKFKGEHINKKRRETYELNKTKLNQIRKQYRENNKDKINKCKREYHNKKSKSDSLYRLKHNIRCIISKSLKKKNFDKCSKTTEILGCDYLTFMYHLESKFDANMSWENHGIYWDIDHIIPLSSAKDQEQILKLNHYTNLQPLEKDFNRYIKKDKIISCNYNNYSEVVDNTAVVEGEELPVRYY